MDARAKRLANLLQRGRRLHWQNARTIAAQRLRVRLPEAPLFRAELVYRAVQLVCAVRFVQAKGYLDGAPLDAFLGQLYHVVAAEEASRLERLVEIYASAFDDERAFCELVAKDLSHAVVRAVTPASVGALSATPRALLKTTCLYCAEVFGDQAAVRALS